MLSLTATSRIHGGSSRVPEPRTFRGVTGFGGMERMRCFWAGLLILRAVVAVSETAAGSPCAARTAEIRDAIRRVHEKQKNVGLAAAVSREGEVVFEDYRGWADLEHRVPVSRETRFGIASVTKAFTGIG